MVCKFFKCMHFVIKRGEKKQMKMKFRRDDDDHSTLGMT